MRYFGVASSLLVLALASSAIADTKPWVFPGKKYRVASGPGGATLGSKTIDFLEESAQLVLASATPERGDTPEREAKIKKLKAGLAARNKRREAVWIPYGTSVIAAAISDKRERFGLPEAALVKAQSGPLAGKSLWVPYATVRTTEPTNGEIATVHGSVLGAFRASDYPSLRSKAAATMVKQGLAFSLSNLTKVKVIGTVVPSLFMIQVLDGPYRGKKMWIARKDVSV